MTFNFRLLRRLSLGISSPFIVALSAGPQMSNAPTQQKEFAAAHSVKLVVKADREHYSLQDTIELSVALRNEGDTAIYVDRRMFWGYGGGLELEIRDQHDKEIPPKLRDDALMPPSAEGDTSVLNRIDPGFFYGRLRKLSLKEYFQAPGNYNIRVRYKSWLRKEEVDTRLRSLPVIWADLPAIESAPISIAILP